MTDRFHVEHESCFHYSDIVLSSYNEARITPLTTPWQMVLDTHLEVLPSASTQRYIDYWGSVVHAFDIQQAHRELTITARSLVVTSGQPLPEDTVSWEALNDESVRDGLAEFTAPTERVPLDPRLAGPAHELTLAGSPVEAAMAAVEWVRDQLTYTPGATGVHTSAITAWEGGKGVCQDFAHLALAITRSAGLPSRYCSGYLYHDDAAETDSGRTFTGESHAWIEVWVGDWLPLDPTGGSAVSSRHVLVARGRDYGDVPPIKGVFDGGPTSHIDVSVRLTRVA